MRCCTPQALTLTDLKLAGDGLVGVHTLRNEGDASRLVAAAQAAKAAGGKVGGGCSRGAVLVLLLYLMEVWHTFCCCCCCSCCSVAWCVTGLVMQGLVYSVGWRGLSVVPSAPAACFCCFRRTSLACLTAQMASLPLSLLTHHSSHDCACIISFLYMCATCICNMCATCMCASLCRRWCWVVATLVLRWQLVWWPTALQVANHHRLVRLLFCAPCATCLSSMTGLVCCPLLAVLLPVGLHAVSLAVHCSCLLGRPC